MQSPHVEFSDADVVLVLVFVGSHIEEVRMKSSQFLVTLFALVYCNILISASPIAKAGSAFNSVVNCRRSKSVVDL